MFSLRITELLPIANRIMEWSLAVKEGEQVLILVDIETDPLLIESLCAATRIARAEPTVVTIRPTKVAGEDPGPIAVRAMEAADVVISPAWPALGHSNSVRKLREAKRIRYMSMPGITSEMIVKGGGSADYQEVFEISQRLVNVLNKAKMINVKTSLGTDLTASIENMPYRVGAALAREPGMIACFPDGEAWGAPVEGTAYGKVVIDCSLTIFGLVREPVVCYVEKGRVVDVQGGSQAKEVKQLISQIANADNIAEIAIGTNPASIITGIISEEKKGLGRVHVALGNNLMLGGKTESKLHLDGVMLEPTVTVDDQIIVEDGEVKI